jgi:hypothetical protein
MLTAGCAAAVAIESTVRIQIISFEIPINAFTAGACGATSRSGFDHDQRGLILLRNFRRR